MNLTLAVIVEASDVPESGFDMFKSRIRNASAMIPYYDVDGRPVMRYDEATRSEKVVYKYDARHILLETNPASNWVKKFLTDSADVRYYGSARNEGYRMSDDPDKQKFTQIISTDANPYLPNDYITNISKGKSPAWVAQFVRGSFNFNDNLVFPNVGLCITKPHPLPRAFNEEGKRVLWFAIGLDYGIVDNTHVVYTAFSTETKKLYVYDELVINNADVRTIAKEYRHNTKINNTDLNGLMMLPRFDGRSYNKRESDLHTIGGAFEALGLYFEPSFTNHEIRIIKMNSLINHDQMEIFSTCEHLIEELLNYSFQLNRDGVPTKTPKDGKDHGITALEFVVVELPHNLQEINMSAYIQPGVKLVHDKELDITKLKKESYFDPLKEDKDYGHITSVTTQKLTMPSAQTIPTVYDGKLTIQKNSTEVGTFSANQSTDATINITVPTKISEITNDKNYQQTFFINYAAELTKPTGAVAGDLVFVAENGTSW